MQGSPGWGPNAPMAQGGAPLPPPRKGTSPGCIVGIVVAVLFFGTIAAVIAKSAVERYAERAREAAEKKRAAEDEDDDAPRRHASSSEPSASASAAGSPAGDGVTVDLHDEGQLKLPAGSKLVKELPPEPNLDVAVAYSLPADRFLVVTMTKPIDLACSMKLDREDVVAKDAAKAPGFDQLFRPVVHERRKLGASEVVYTEMDNRSPAEAKRDAPFHHGAGYLLCGKRALVSLTLAKRSGALTDEDRAEITRIAASLGP